MNEHTARQGIDAAARDSAKARLLAYFAPRYSDGAAFSGGMPGFEYDQIVKARGPEATRASRGVVEGEEALRAALEERVRRRARADHMERRAEFERTGRGEPGWRRNMAEADRVIDAATVMGPARRTLEELARTPEDQSAALRARLAELLEPWLMEGLDLPPAAQGRW